MRTDATPLIVLLCDDLMWISRVLATAQTLGIRVLVARDQDRLAAVLREEKPQCTLVDLASAPIAECAGKIKALCPGTRLIAFGSHVDAAGLRAAKDAGCDPVLTRGELAEEMVSLLPQWVEP